MSQGREHFKFEISPLILESWVATEPRALGISHIRKRGTVSRLGCVLALSHATGRASSPKRLRSRCLGSVLAAALALIAALGLTSCGAAPASTAVTCTTTTSTSTSTTSTSTCTDPVTNISVTISPATVSVNVVTEQQFQVSIQGGTNSITIWQVN